MFKIFYILGLKYEIYKTKKDNAFAKTVADGFRNASEKKLAEVKPLYEQVDEMKKIDSHKREDRDKVKDLESQINTINGEIDEMVDTANSVYSSISRHENEIKSWKAKIEFTLKS